MICVTCNKKFPVLQFINGKRYDLRRRTHCLECVPFGTRYKLPGELKQKGKRVERTCNICNKIFLTKNCQGTCSTCKSRRMRNKKKEWAVKLLGGKCKMCGYDKSIKSLVFHHLDPKIKSLQLSNSWERSKNELLKELNKCELLCRNCHGETH